MASKSKVKGNTYERELVNQFKEHGLAAERARGSDGRSLGFAEDVDGYFKLSRKGKKIKFQAKRRKSIPQWLQTGNSDIVIFREDRGKTHILCDLDFFLEVLRK